MDVQKLDMEKWRAGITPTAPDPAIRDNGGENCKPTRLAALALNATAPPSTGDQKIPEREVCGFEAVGGESSPRRLPWWKQRPAERLNLSLQGINLVWVFVALVVGCLLLGRILTSAFGSEPVEAQIRYLSHSNPVITSCWQWILASYNAITEHKILKERDDLDVWIDRERKLAFQSIIDNIGPAAGAGDGIVIASPSMGDVAGEPDYYYTWTRDAALTISALLPSFLPNEYERPWKYQVPSSFPNDTTPEQPFLEPLLRAYIDSQACIQARSNPSGDLWSGGLNEPKFHVDGSRFDGEWGRPQRDGPALRALAMIPYAHFLLDRGWSSDVEYVERHLYDPSALRKVGSVIKNDLEEVGGGWWLESFDLWEEVSGHHLFTLLACLRALQAGAILARRLEDPRAAEYYTAQSEKIIDILPAFWDDDLYWRSTAHIDPGDTINEQSQEDRAWLDCAFPLSVIHAGSGELLGANESETLATLWKYIKSFEGLYHLNRAPQYPSSESPKSSASRPWKGGWAVGRYKEDVYNGIGISKGNPWYICTFAVANVLYLAKESFERQGYISVNNLTRSFWFDLLGGNLSGEEEIWTMTRDGDQRKGMFETSLRALLDTADHFMGVGRAHAPDGRMSEQMDRHDGSPVGARDLTWSYASFLEAARARDRAGRPAMLKPFT